MQSQNQETPTYAGALAASQSASMEAVAMTLRSMGQVCDMGLTVAQMMLRSQAHAATAFGLPDLSDAVPPPSENGTHVFSDGAEQLISTAQKAADDGAQLQRHLGEAIDAQSAAVTEQLQSGMEELAAQTREGLARLQDGAEQFAEQAADAANNAASTAADAASRAVSGWADATKAPHEHLTPEEIVARDGPFKHS